MFLIETLPAEGKKNTAVETTTKNKSLLMQNISNKIGEDLKSIWIPPCCMLTMQKIGDFGVTYFSNHFLLDKEQLVEKLLKIKETKAHTEEKETVIVNDNILPEIREKIEFEMDKSLGELKEMAIVLRQKLDTLESDKNMMQVEYNQVKDLLDHTYLI